MTWNSGVEKSKESVEFWVSWTCLHLKKIGLKMNISKTKLMTNLVISKIFTISEQTIELVHSYKYLGHKISLGGTTKTKNSKRRLV